VEERAVGFGDEYWVQMESVTIRPGESIADLEKRLSEEHGTEVRIHVPSWQEE
jgi:hypothetical protein